MKLCVRRVDDGGTAAADCDAPAPVFDCERDVATTRFVYAPGTYDISLVPLCPDGTAAKNLDVPAPIERELKNGQLAELNALLVVIQSPTLSPCSAAP